MKESQKSKVKSQKLEGLSKKSVQLILSVSSMVFLISQLSFLISSADAAPGINKTINFQGKLVNSNGTNVTDDTYSVVFTVYDAASGGTNLWDETQNVTTNDGIFQVSLGSVDTTLANVNFNTDNLYLGIKVGVDAEMTPRVRFSAVPYAFNAEKVGGLTVTNTTGTFTLIDSKTLTVNNTMTFAGTDGTTLTFQGTDTYVGRATTDTLTNKTLTAPRFADGGFLADGNGNELLIFDSNASAVNQVTLTNAATGNGLTFSATGDDSNVALSIISKAGGALTLDSGTTGAVNLGTGANAKAISIGNSNASTTMSLTGGDDWSVSVAGAATFASLTGAGLTNCSAATSKLLWNSASGLFSCGTDLGSNLQTIGLDDTTTESLTGTNTVILDNGGTTYLAITPANTSSSILINVSIRVDSDGTDSEVDLFELRRTTDGTNPTCSSTLVGSAMEIETTNADDDGWVVGNFVDAPSTTNEVRYTVCGRASAGTASNDTNQITLTLSEIGSSSGGGGGGNVSVRESDGSPAVATASTIEFGPDSASSDEFIVTDEGSGVARIRLGDQVGILNQAETVTGGWIFNTAAITFGSLLQANGGITTSTTDQDLEFSVNGEGDIIFTTDTTSAVGIGTSNPQATLDIFGANGTQSVANVLGETSFAALSVDNTGVGDIFTASSAGVSKFTVTNAGGITLANGESIDNATTDNTIILSSDATDGAGVVRIPVKTTSGDPSLNSGGNIYYNQADGKFRCYQVSSWTDCIGSAEAGEAIVFGAYDSAGGDNIGAGVTVNLDTERTNTDTGIFTLSGDELTINDDGLYIFQYRVSATLTSGTRGAVRAYMEENAGSGFAEIAGSRAWAYGRIATYPEATAVGFLALQVTSGDSFRVRALVEAANFSTVADGSSLLVYKATGVVDGGGGGGGSFTVRETDGSPSVSTATTLEFGPAFASSDEFIITDQGSGVARIRLGNQVGLLNAASTVTGGWTFDTAATTFTTTIYANGGLTTTSDQDLSLAANGAGNVVFNVDGDSWVGLGTDTPVATLDVRGQSGTTAVANVLGETSFATLSVDNTGIGDIFTASSSGVTRLTLLQNGGLQVNSLNAASCDVKSDTTGLLFCGTDAVGAGGATWTSDIDADGYDLTDLSNIVFGETTGAPVGTDVGLYRDNSGDLNVNVLAGKALNVQVNGMDEYSFSSTGFILGTNDIVTGATTISSTELDRLDGKDAALVDQNDFTTGDGSGATSSGSGLEAGTGGIGLLQGCADDQVLKWNDSSAVWECGTDRGSFHNIMDGDYTNTTTTFTDVDNNSDDADNIGFPIGSNEQWIFFMNVQLLSNTTADQKWQVTAPSGATCDISVANVEQTISVSNIGCGTTSGSIAADAATNNIIITGSVRNGATAGNAQLQYGQVAASGTSTIFAGSYINAYRVDGADLAEVYYATNAADLRPGTVLSLDSRLEAGVTRSSRAYDRQLVGIVTTKPGLVIGEASQPGNGQPVMVALSGRVPVVVSTENGMIEPGDYLTSSSVPGVAMKATKAGAIIGQAMTGYAGSETGTVVVFIKTGFSQGASIASLIPGLSDSQRKVDQGKATLAYLVAQRQITQEPLSLSEITTDRVVAGLELVTPRVIADEIIAKTIKAETIEGLDVLIANGIWQMVYGTATNSSVTANASESSRLTDAYSNDILRPSDEGAHGEVLALNSLNVDGLATVSGTLRVKENSLIEGILTVVDTLMTKNLVVSGLATFFDAVVFKGDVTFAGIPTFSKNTAGFAVVKKGADRVEVIFEKEYKYTPVVNVSVSLEKVVEDTNEIEETRAKEVLGSNLSYIVTKRTTKGFTILLKQPTEEDVTFSWTAFAIKDASTFASRDLTQFIPTPTVFVPSPSQAGGNPEGEEVIRE